MNGLIKEAQTHINALENKIRPLQRTLEEIDAEITALKKQNASVTIPDNQELFDLQDRYIAYYDAHADVLDPAEELIDQYSGYIQSVRTCMENAVSNSSVSQLRNQLESIIERENHAFDVADSQKQPEIIVKKICPECGFELITEQSSYADETCPSCGTLLVEEAECETYNIEPALPYLVQDDDVESLLEQMSPEELYDAYMNEGKNSAEYRQLCYQQMLKIGIVEHPDAGLYATLMQTPTKSDDQQGVSPRSRWIRIIAVVSILTILLTIILIIQSNN